jgi:altronate dehydratase
VSPEAAADELLAQVIAVASGARTKSEQRGLPETEFVPWMPGPIV